MNPIARIILTKLEPQGVENSEDLLQDPQDHISALKSVAEDMITHFQNKDADGLAQSLCEFWYAMQNANEEEEI